MPGRFGAELQHCCKVRNVAKVSGAILSIERILGAGIWIPFIQNTVFPSAHLSPLRCKRYFKGDGSYIEIFPNRSDIAKFGCDYYGHPCQLHFGVTSTSARNSQLRTRNSQSKLTGMIERKEGRLAGDFNLKNLIERWKFHGGYLLIFLLKSWSTQTWQINPRKSDVTLAISPKLHHFSQLSQSQQIDVKRRFYLIYIMEYFN